MGRKKSEFVSAFDIASRIFKSLTNAVMDKGGSDEDVRRIETDKDLREQIAGLIVKTVKMPGQIFKVTVDYSQSLHEMIAVGKFDWKNSDIIEKHFPLPKIPAGLPTKVKLTLELVHFNHSINSDEALTELKKRGMRPATLPELLAFGAKYPNIQREFPIVALGSVWRYWSGLRSVPYLWGDGFGRYLYLFWFEDVWSSFCRFLAVREV